MVHTNTDYHCSKAFPEKIDYERLNTDVLLDTTCTVLTFKILKNGLSTVLPSSVAKSATDVNHWNKRVLLKSDVQDSLNLLDKKPSSAFDNNHPKFKYRKFNDDMSARTRSKADHNDQSIGSRTRSKCKA